MEEDREGKGRQSKMDWGWIQGESISGNGEQGESKRDGFSRRSETKEADGADIHAEEPYTSDPTNYF